MQTKRTARTMLTMQAQSATFALLESVSEPVPPATGLVEMVGSDVVSDPDGGTDVETVESEMVDVVVMSTKSA